ncbi:MAG: hypothetical protein IPI67_16915 [Myxococcales bacterium]|nr:hypothetical protein [Myxococcales bacterium]
MTWFGFERRWLAELWATLLPSGTSGGLSIGARDVDLGRFLDELLTHAPARVTLGARVCLWLLVLCPLFVIRRFVLFPSLSDDERLKVLEKLRSSDVYLVRELPLLFKMLGALGFAGLPAVQAALSIDVRDESPPTWARGTEP